MLSLSTQKPTPLTSLDVNDVSISQYLSDEDDQWLAFGRESDKDLTVEDGDAQGTASGSENGQGSASGSGNDHGSAGGSGNEQGSSDESRNDRGSSDGRGNDQGSDSPEIYVIRPNRELR